MSDPQGDAAQALRNARLYFTSTIITTLSYGASLSIVHAAEPN
jgi:hypothetical protein